MLSVLLRMNVPLIKFSQENGVQTAIQAIYRDLEYAKTLIKARNIAAGHANPLSQSTIFGIDGSPTRPSNTNADPTMQSMSTSGFLDEDDNEGAEEAWTFIGDESDPELQRRIQDWNSPGVSGRSVGEIRTPRVSLSLERTGRVRA